jgi:indoleamine 2,3-dioxygenase
MFSQTVQTSLTALAAHHTVLEEFDVGLKGFLPSDLPLTILPDPYYTPWESVINQLSELIQSREIRDEVEQLPVLSVDHLTTIAEWRRAYLILAFLAHGYVWGGDTPSEILPPPVSVPLLQVSRHLDLPPVATYAALNLWNFTSSSSDLTSPNTLRALHTFTGTEDESWFYIISVAMEAQGATIMPLMLGVLEATSRNDYLTITTALDDLSSCIRQLKSLLGRMHEKCNPQVFFHRIRPFLAGSKNMAAAGLSNGVYYDGGDGRGEWKQLRGGSNGQSSLIQFLDVVLGVEHVASGNSSPEPDSGGKELSFHEEVRGYMPGPHRRFLERVASMGSIRDLVAQLGNSPEEECLREAFQAATRTLADFRNKHLEIVARYITIPARQQAAGATGKVNLASTLSGKYGVAGEKIQELTGTGGTALLPFLKQVRDDTVRAGVL